MYLRYNVDTLWLKKIVSADQNANKKDKRLKVREQYEENM